MTVRSSTAVAGQTIWKFALHPFRFEVDMPAGAEILSAGAQGADVVVWALVDPNAPVVSRRIGANPPGHHFPPALIGARFVGTAQMDDGLVFHVFDGGES